MDPGQEVVCRRSSYKRLTVQPAVATGVEQLSVTGVVMGRNEAGAECVLLGRRGRRTRIYGGMWELAPSGGIEAGPERRTLCEADLVEQLQREYEEETGSRDRLSAVRAAAVVHDPVAHSYDVVFVCRAPLAQAVTGLEVQPDRWEYEGVRWMPVASLARFDRENSADIIAPTRALLRFFGWAS
jgi:ADP-ribose pyrophosphatase YjhB (NUDIX family)